MMCCHPQQVLHLSAAGGNIATDDKLMQFCNVPNLGLTTRAEQPF